MSTDDLKIPLPKFIKVFTSSGVPVAKAMSFSGKLYKNTNTATSLRNTTDKSLIQAGILEKDDRKLILSAIKKAGYLAKVPTMTTNATDRTGVVQSAMDGPANVAGPSKAQTTSTPSPTKKRKRRKASDTNEFLPEQSDVHGSFEFNEILDEETLKTKTTVINRAPLMTAWATMVAERLGFQREEALSIASVYTEMNAVAKGVSLGIFKSHRDIGLEATKGGSQPYVNLMGRRPLYQSQNSQWRALNKGVPVEPGDAFSYINRSFRQTTPYIIGALRLLAESYSTQAINDRAWSLYADFRPEVDGWGKRGETRCDTILGLRRPVSVPTAPAISVSSIIKVDDEETGPPTKRARTEAPAEDLDEFEAELGWDPAFNDIDLGVGDAVA